MTSAAVSQLVEESIPNLVSRYKGRVTPTPRKLPNVLGSFKTTLWWTAAEWKELLQRAAGLKTGKMSLQAYLRHELGLEGARDRVPRAQQIALVRTMIRPPKPVRNELAARRRRKRIH